MASTNEHESLQDKDLIRILNVLNSHSEALKAYGENFIELQTGVIQLAQQVGRIAQALVETQAVVSSIACKDLPEGVGLRFTDIETEDDRYE